MKLIGNIIFHIFSNTLAILTAAYFIQGFSWKGSFPGLLLTALVFTAINMTLKPILKLFLGPFIVLTFGLFSIIINAVVLYLLDLWSPSLTIEGSAPLFWGTLIIGVVNLLVGFAAKRLYRK